MNIIKKHKERISSFLLFFMVASIALPTQSWAVGYQLVANTQKKITASASATGTGTVTLNVNWRTLGSASSAPDATSLAWDAAEITLGTTKWKRAKTYAKISGSITKGDGGYQIYTDNKGAATTPFVVNPNNPTADPSGLYSLIGGVAGGTLPLAWRVSDTELTDTQLAVLQDATLTDLELADNAQNRAIAQSHLYSDTDGNGTISAAEKKFPAYLYMKDSNSPADTIFGTPAIAGDAGNFNDYSKIRHADFGTQIGAFTWSRTSGDDYVYFEADFTNSLEGRNYIGNVIIEAFTE